MTDEDKRNNYEKYGNPDGPGSFHVAIAMPKFLLEKEHQIMVLTVFFLILLVVIPGYFIINLSTDNEEGCSVKNKPLYASLLNENLIYKHCPWLLASSIEF